MDVWRSREREWEQLKSMVFLFFGAKKWLVMRQGKQIILKRVAKTAKNTDFLHFWYGATVASKVPAGNENDRIF